MLLGFPRSMSVRRKLVSKGVWGLLAFGAVAVSAVAIGKVGDQARPSALGDGASAVLYPSHFADAPLLHSISSPQPKRVARQARPALVPYVLDPVIGRTRAPSSTRSVPKVRPTAPAVGGVGVPAQLSPFTPEKTFLASHPTTDFGADPASAADDRTGTTEWRMVVGT